MPGSAAVILLVAVSTLGGCDTLHRAEWTEDVRLADGSTIVLARDQEYDGQRQIFQAPVPSSYGFEFRMPGSGERVSWASGIDLVPVAILMGHGRPILLTTPLPHGMMRHQCPDPPYLVFEFVEGKWTAMPLADLPVRVVSPNMTGILSTYDSAATGDRRPHLTAADVRARLPEDLRGRFVDLSGVERQVFGTHCLPPYDVRLRDVAD